MVAKLSLVAVTVVLGTAVFEFYLRVPVDESKKIPFEIKKDSGVHLISGKLRESKLISSSFIFETYVWLTRSDRNFKAGEYELAPGMSMRRLVGLLTEGVGREEMSVTILEGWALRDIKKYLASEGVKEMANFDYYAGVSAAAAPSAYNWSGEFPFLAAKPRELGLEGFLFPDTYRIFADARSVDVIRKMLQNFGTKFDASMSAEAKRKNMSVFEVVTLASVVEREVQTPEDMRKVAGIFLRRLEIGMPLQADSTVNYVTGKLTPSISYDDRDISSPWNTYKYRGLPKGPIGNPGLAAIEAVLNPETTPYLYFLTTKEGRVIYSKTLEEHNIAKAKYLK